MARMASWVVTLALLPNTIDSIGTTRGQMKIGEIAPDFEAETSEGKIKFHDWIGKLAARRRVESSPPNDRRERVRLRPAPLFVACAL
jgi:hypothetical protein